MKAMFTLISAVLLTVSVQASDRDCTCRGEDEKGKAITVVYNGRTGLNSMAEAHVQIKVKGTAQKYYKNLPVFLGEATVGQKYVTRGPDFLLELNVPASLNVGDKFTADYFYGRKLATDVHVVLTCTSTRIQ